MCYAHQRALAFALSYIQMAGHVESLNVSVAARVVLFAAARYRRDSQWS